MRRPTSSVFTTALALGVMMLLASASARADGREEGPTEIEKCQTIDKPGSYKLVRDITFAATFGTCLPITASDVTIDLAGFTISGPGGVATAIGASPSQGQVVDRIAVRNGSISGFNVGVDLRGRGSIVEGLRVSGLFFGIVAAGIVKGNTVVVPVGTGISAAGIITGNFVINCDLNYSIGEGSTVIGNTAVGDPHKSTVGFRVACPSNVTDNTAVNNDQGKLVLNGAGCNNTNNVAP